MQAKTISFKQNTTEPLVTTRAHDRGIANPTADVTVGVSGGTAYTASRKGEYFHHALTVGNEVYPAVEVKSLYGGTETDSGDVFNPPATESFSHDLDGNLKSDGRWDYTWNGENRLIQMIRDESTPSGARQRITFEYDHQGRRIRKTFEKNGGRGWFVDSDIVFLYDGWNLMAELDADNGNEEMRTYIWGLDLSGTEQGAGGVGGLLKVTQHDGPSHHFVAYDGNGNVAALVDGGNGAITARYEYGPFGEPLRATGTMGGENPIRFSSKYTDGESGLVYYGFRYYNPTTGRWLKRDPIAERGGRNLYRSVNNRPLTAFDAVGLSIWSKCKDLFNCCDRCSKSDPPIITGLDIGLKPYPSLLGPGADEAALDIFNDTQMIANIQALGGFAKACTTVGWLANVLGEAASQGIGTGMTWGWTGAMLGAVDTIGQDKIQQSGAEVWVHVRWKACESEPCWFTRRLDWQDHDEWHRCSASQDGQGLGFGMSGRAAAAEISSAIPGCIAEALADLF